MADALDAELRGLINRLHKVQAKIGGGGCVFMTIYVHKNFGVYK